MEKIEIESPRLEAIRSLDLAISPMAWRHAAGAHARRRVPSAHVGRQPAFLVAGGSDPGLVDRPGPDDKPSARRASHSRARIHDWSGVLLDSLVHPGRRGSVFSELATRRRHRPGAAAVGRGHAAPDSRLETDAIGLARADDRDAPCHGTVQSGTVSGHLESHRRIDSGHCRNRVDSPRLAPRIARADGRHGRHRLERRACVHRSDLRRARRVRCVAHRCMRRPRVGGSPAARSHHRRNRDGATNTVFAPSMDNRVRRQRHDGGDEQPRADAHRPRTHPLVNQWQVLCPSADVDSCDSGVDGDVGLDTHPVRSEHGGPSSSRRHTADDRSGATGGGHPRVRALVRGLGFLLLHVVDASRGPHDRPRDARWIPARLARVAGVAFLAGALAIVPARVGLATTLFRMPQYLALVSGSKEIIKRRQPMQSIGTEFDLHATTDPEFIFRILGGRIDRRAPWRAVILPDGRVEYRQPGGGGYERSDELRGRPSRVGSHDDR